MGDNQKLGEKLNKVHKPTFDYKLLASIFVLVVIGVVGSFSFNSIFSYQDHTTPLTNPYFFKNLIWVVMGLIAFIIGYFVKLKILKKFSIPMYIVAFAIYVFYIFTSSSSSEQYGYELGPVSISVLPWLPLLFLFGIAGIYTKLKFKNIKSMILAIILGLLPLVCMAYSFKFVPMFIYFGIALLVILYVFSRNVKLIIGTGILEVLIFLATSLKGLNILLTSNFGSPQTVTKILTTSKLIGENHTTMTYINLSYPIVSAIGYFGWIFGIAIVLILIYFIFRLIKISASINNAYGKSLAFSISTILIVQTIWGTLMNFNLMPYAGVAIPFVSYSGTLFVFGLFILGILTNIYSLKTLKNI